MSKSKSPLHSSDSRSHSVFARIFRRALLARRDSMTGNHREYLRSIFPNTSDDNAIITTIELKKFLTSLNLSPFIQEEEVKVSTVKFISLLLQQVDIDHTGNICYADLCEFLWPSTNDFQDAESVSQIVRQAIIDSVGRKLVSRSAKSSGDDLYLLEAFSKKVSVPLVRGSMISTRTLRKSLPRLVLCDLGIEIPMSHVDTILATIDSNGDGVVSAREFKTWLFLNGENILFRRRSTVVQSGTSVSPRIHGSPAHTPNDAPGDTYVCTPDRDDSTVVSGISVTDSLVSASSPRSPERSRGLSAESDILSAIQTETEELQRDIEEIEVAQHRALVGHESTRLFRAPAPDTPGSLSSVNKDFSPSPSRSYQSMTKSSTSAAIHNDSTVISPIHSQVSDSQKSDNKDDRDENVRDDGVEEKSEVVDTKSKNCLSCLWCCKWRCTIAVVYDPIDEQKA